jgi:HAD superfamily hydrolase (TIGR01509 family)
MIKAVIFDMDGLLINSEPIWFKAKKELMQGLNIGWTWDDQKNSMGVSTDAWTNYLYEKANRTVGKEELRNGVVTKMRQFYESGQLETMPGANEALIFSKENFKVGLASGSYKDLLYSAVKFNKWESFFDEILSSDDLKLGKPNPAIYLEIVKRLGVLPEECIVLEDSRDGIKAGVAAGTNVVAVPSKEFVVPQEVLDSAYAVIDSLYEFPKIVEEFNN